MKTLDPVRNPMDRTSYVFAGVGVLTAGALLFNLLPILLGVMADALLLEPHQIGILGGAYMFGFAFASVPAVYLIENRNWRWVMALGSLVVAG